MRIHHSRCNWNKVSPRWRRRRDDAYAERPFQSARRRRGVVVTGVRPVNEVIAKFHYTDPRGPARTRTDPNDPLTDHVGPGYTQVSFPVRKRTGMLRIWRAREREPIWGSGGGAPSGVQGGEAPPEAEGILLPKRANLSLSFK